MSTRKTVLIAFLMIIFILGAAENLTSGTDEYQLTIDVDEVSAMPGDQVEIPIYLTNLDDVIMGFEMMFTLSRPDIFLFDVDPDPAVTLEGTILEGWWSVGTNDYGTGGAVLSVFGSTVLYTGVTPYDGSTPFIKLVGHVLDIPDTLQDRTVTININTDMLDNFSFSDPYGHSIGVITDTIAVERCFSCLAYYNDTCIYWDIVDCDDPEAQIDSVFCCDMVLHSYLDTGYVHVESGSVTALRDICGDYNGDQAGNILDILYAIACMYGVNPDCDLSAIDVNCDGNSNIIDITYYIAYLYQSGPEPCCSP